MGNVKTKWDQGNLIYCDADGNELMTLNAAAGTVHIPSLTGENGVTEQPAIADISVADATDLTTTQALANANKAKINAILAALRAAHIIASG